ncbi:MAG TPA: cupredoxin domain-containing protein [Candidatus Nanoarchaeia archaeon]|nr:cupredoxin domain-containing protein [Candidatus Nanoarchaeia archaeon]
MNNQRDNLTTVAIFLVVFMIIVAVSIWLLDLIAQQREFGLLASAEFVAFAMLAGIYYEDNPQNISTKWLAGGFAAIALLVILAGALFAGVGSPPKPNVSVTLYAGEISSSVYGFGNASTSLTSPGPTLTFKVGDVVNLTLVNAGMMPHDWAIVETNETSGSVLFGAQVASANLPVETNQSESVVFTVGQAGSFVYICQIPGHLQVGMWGNVVVNP